MGILMWKKHKNTNIVSNNKYDYLIIFILLLQALGGIGAALQPIRVVIIFCIPFTFMFFLKHTIQRKYYFPQILFFSLWWLYAFITLLWSIDTTESVKNVIYLFINFNGFFVLIWLSSRANNPQNSIVKGWLGAFILTLPIALYELWFDQHLPISVEDSGLMMNLGQTVIHRKFASVTFGNLNGYNTFLCYVLPFLLFSLINPFKKNKSFLYWILLLAISYIIILNSSRGALLVLGVAMILFFLYYFKSKRSKLTISFSIILILTVIYFVFRQFKPLFEVIAVRFAIQGFGDQGRLENILAGWDALKNSCFLGIGTGNYIPVMLNKYYLYNPSPHNLFWELAVQYGILFLLGFILLLFKILKLGIKNNQRVNKYFVIISLSVLPLLSIIDSSYLLGVPIWMFLASLMIIADNRYNFPAQMCKVKLNLVN